MLGCRQQPVTGEVVEEALQTEEEDLLQGLFHHPLLVRSQQSQGTAVAVHLHVLVARHLKN